MKKPLPICLLLLRLAIFIVMLVWAIDKFMRPMTEAAMYQHAYHLPPLPAMIMYAIGAFQIRLGGVVAGRCPYIARPAARHAVTVRAETRIAHVGRA